jgi:hypothetical protein
MAYEVVRKEGPFVTLGEIEGNNPTWVPVRHSGPLVNTVNLKFEPLGIVSLLGDKVTVKLSLQL